MFQSLVEKSGGKNCIFQNKIFFGIRNLNNSKQSCMYLCCALTVWDHLKYFQFLKISKHRTAKKNLNILEINETLKKYLQRPNRLIENQTHKKNKVQTRLCKFPDSEVLEKFNFR